MLDIDGSMGEGGGQLVRSAVALSALSGVPVTITRIRANRKTPGLAAQHIAAVKAVAASCDAECRGASLRSGRLAFVPQEPLSRTVTVDVGTAGSIPLIIQAWLPVALSVGGTLHVTGGTEVARSPTIDYLDHVFAAVLRSVGADIRLRVLKRGYFPEGGGEVEVTVQKKEISPIVPPASSEAPCRIFSCSSNLPDHVADRQASAASALIGPELNVHCTTMYNRQAGPGTGSSITAVLGAKGGIALGRRGLPAEEVGRMAARALVVEAGRPGTVDSHLADQLLVPVGIYGGSFSTGTLSLHAKTVCRLLHMFGYTLRVREGMCTEVAA